MVQAIIKYIFLEDLLHSRFCASAEDRMVNKADLTSVLSAAF